MGYIIEGAREMSGEKRTFFIKNNKFAYILNEKKRLNVMKMNGEGFVLTPGRVMIDFSILSLHDFSEYRQRLIELQRQGCTTVLTICQISSEFHLKHSLKAAREHMLNSSIDYVFGISFPLKKLTPSLIRMCKREKVPFLFVQVNDESDIDAIAWQWIREALFQYPLTIVPDWRSFPEYPEKEFKKVTNDWNSIMQQNNIPTFALDPEKYPILQKNSLKKTGIYPLKGELLVGGDIDYNLYLNNSLAERRHLHYDIDWQPDIVVMKGTLLKAGAEVKFRPGFGKEVIVKVPGFFMTYSK